MSDYGCPKCGECPPEEQLYYVENGELIDRTKYTETGLVAKPKRGKKIYPIYSNFVTNTWASMEFGGNPRDWDETHMCVNCEKEYTFSNSDY